VLLEIKRPVLIENKVLLPICRTQPTTFPQYGTDPPADDTGGPLREKNEWKICQVQKKKKKQKRKKKKKKKEGDATRTTQGREKKT